MEQRSSSQLLECIADGQHKVSKRQWQAVKQAINKAEDNRVPSDLGKLTQCRTKRSIRHLLLDSAAFNETVITPEVESIIENVFGNDICDADLEKTLKKAATSFKNNIERLICLTDEDSALALPLLSLNESEVMKILHLGNPEQGQNEIEGGNDSSSTGSDESLSEYDSDEADVEFLDKKAVERVVDRRQKTRIALQALAARRAASLGKVKNIQLLERQMLACSPTHMCISKDVEIEESKHPRKDLTKPKKLFSGVAAHDEFSVGTSAKMEDEELEQKLANLKSALVKQQKLLTAAEKGVPKALKNSRDTVEVVSAYVHKVKTSNGPSNPIEKALFSVEKKRPKEAIERLPLPKRNRRITPESRFLSYLQKA